MKELKDFLKVKPFWATKEVMRELFGAEYSDDQVTRILVGELGMS